MFTGKKKAVSYRAAAVFVASLILIWFVAAVISQNIKDNTVYVNSDVLIMGVGQEYDYPMENKALVRFKSYNKKVVDVDKNGVFTALSKGSALVRIGKSELTVYVEDAPSSIAFSEEGYTLGAGEAYKVTLNIGPSKINSGLEFTSSDPKVIEVNSGGVLKGVSKGTANVSVKSYNGLSASCSVTVENAPESVNFPYSEKTVYLGTTSKLVPELSDGSASLTTTVDSDNKSVVKVEGEKLVPVAEGTANVTATTYNGKTATCKITVANAPFYIRTDLDPSKPMIALSFDDGPNKSSTSRILDTLESNNGSATFFIVASRLASSANASCATRMVEIGCELGNHTYDHTHYGKDVTAEDISKASDVIKEVTGHTPSAFRPTGGYLSDVIKQNCNAPICIWSVDTNDWKHRDAQRIKNYVLDTAKDGDVILMHDIYETSANAVEQFVPELVNRGFQIVNIAELAYYKDAQLQNGEIYYSF